MRPLALAVLMLAPPPVVAQDVECYAPETTPDMSFCASEAFDAADGELNVAYQAAMGVARRYGDFQVGLLRDAQRAWIAFRDAACSAEGSLYEGGTFQPIAGTECKTRLTEARTQDLWDYASMGE